jgi:hypothetical protein
MNKNSDQTNTIFFLIIIAITIGCWTFFDIYHKQNPETVSPEITSHINTPLPPSFDEETLNKLYEGEPEFYPVSEEEF